MLVLTIAVNVVVLLWGLVLVLGLPVGLAVLGTLLAAGIVAAVRIRDRLAAKRGAKAIESALGAQADAFAKDVRPDQLGEIEEMRQQFKQELAALQSSKLGGGGSAALYSLPWYMIIGPPGSGKSTAIRNSGLNFPAKKGAIRGIGGTRNCDWWLTNEAVLLDTAGRYSTEDEDREEWLAFLDTLKKNRPKKPLNGLVVAVSVTDLGGQSEEAVAGLARRIRERIDEVSERLAMVFPVYVMFTKCDLITGFVETFGNMNKGQRAQVWGATFPLDQHELKLEEALIEAVDELDKVLGRRTYMRLEEERRPEWREKIYQFPQQFRAIRGALEHFANELFVRDVYHEPPLCRGIYLTSGTQEGRPIDLLASSLLESFGLKPVDAAEEAGEAKSYFLGEVFGKVMFPDQDVAARSAQGHNVVLLRRAAIGGGAFATAALLTFLPLSAYRQNRAVVQSTREIVEAVVTERDHNRGKVVPPSELESLRTRLRELKTWEKGAPPIAMRFGMFQGGTIFPVLQRFYIQLLQRELFAPILQNDLEQMQTLKRVYGYNSRPSDEEYKRYFDKLKLHLMLTAPHAPNEPPLEGAREQWVVADIRDRWSAALGSVPDSATREQMQAHILFYLELLRDNPALAIARDEVAVRDTRNMLNRISFAEAVVKQLVVEMANDDRDLNMRRIAGGSVTPITSDRGQGVRAAFTRWGWDNVVRERLAEETKGGDRWVYTTDASDHDRDKALAELRSAYFTLYIQEWRDFIASLRVAQPTDVADSLRMLTELTRGEPPVHKRLLQEIADNTALREKEATGIGGAASKVASGLVDRIKTSLGGEAKAAMESGQAALQQRYEGLIGARAVEEGFKDLVRFGVAASEPATSDKAPPAAPKSVPMDLVLEQYGLLRDAIQGYLQNPNDAAQLVGKIQAARTAVQGVLGQNDLGPVWRARIASLIWPPIEHVSDSLVALKADVSRKWCNAVVSPYVRSLRRRYPFEESSQEATIADVTAFFAPKAGILWGFYQAELQQDVVQTGSRFKLDARLGGMLNRAYQPALLGYLSKAFAVTSTLFPPGGQDPRLNFDVRMEASASFSSITLEVGGESVEYKGGPERWKRISWPSGKPAEGAAIRVLGRSGNEETLQFPGEWGLFRLLRAGTVSGRPHNETFTMHWPIGRAKSNVAIDFQVAGARTGVFVPHKAGKARMLLGDLTPPPTIANGSPTCNP